MSPHHAFSIAGIVRQWSQRRPDAPCLTDADGTRSWADVADRSARLAGGLHEAGVVAGDRVAFLAKNNAASFELMFAASMVGAVSHGVNWRLAPGEIRDLLDHSGAKALLADDELDDRFGPIAAELPALRKIAWCGTGRRRTDPEGDRIDVRDGGRHEGYEDWLTRLPPKDPQAPIADDDTVVQGHTSGTTGVPKGAMISNAAVRASVALAEHVGVRTDAVVLVAMPLFHAAGSTWGLCGLSVGAHCVVAREVVPAEMLRLIDEQRVTTTLVVPAVLQLLLDEPTRRHRDLSSLETIVYAGSPISPTLLQRCLDAFDCEFIQMYGMTESNNITMLPAADHTDPSHPERLRSAGRPVPGVTLRVVDPASGDEQPEGESGEIWVRAPSNTHGYWRNADATAAAMTADGFLRTGDGGFVRDGYLYMRDRIKDMIITGGENVYPLEVEHVIAAHPAVAEVAVIGVPSARWGETVKAVVVRAAERCTVSADELIAFTRNRLAHYKCPTSVDFVDALPRNPSGKVLKRELRRPYWEGAGQPTG